jgi:hypothetical protein
MLYTIQNTILGNPDPSWRITNDVKLPAYVNDSVKILRIKRLTLPKAEWEDAYIHDSRFPEPSMSLDYK